MNRRLFLIIDHGTGTPLQGVDQDLSNYLNFFKSNYGGAWEDDEIDVCVDNFSLGRITAAKTRAQSLHNPLDYMLIVFCGHGAETPEGELYYEFKPDTETTLSELRNMVKGTRCLFIADSCRGIERLADGGRLSMFSAVNEAAANDYERQICKELYNNAIARVPQGTFTAGFAASSGQYANEGRFGGYYSSALLKVADVECKRLGRLNDRYPDNEIIPFISIHDSASSIVSKKTAEDQVPDYITTRYKYQFPFIVVPDYQRLLP